MSTAALPLVGQGMLRYSRWDALLVALALGHGILLLALPIVPVLALGVWWNSNTISHNFIHKPFFRSRGLNRLFSLYLSLLLGIPQSIWRDRHLAHHANAPWKLRPGWQMCTETASVLSLWCALVIMAPYFFLVVYLPGYVIGLMLCRLHGYYEHVSGTISHHGFLYNWLFFNDGYHFEHHAQPGLHWTLLPLSKTRVKTLSRWPAVFRWLDCFTLESLERWLFQSRLLQSFVLNRHKRAFRRLLPLLPAPKRIAIIGGGLFPRTLLVLRQLVPDAEFVVIDASEENLRTAQSHLGPTEHTEFRCAWYDPGRHSDFDIVVIPLAYIGERAALYLHPPAKAMLIHDWLWRRHRPGVWISFFLLKRLNLVRA